MAPLNHVSDSTLVVTVAAALSVLGHHTHTAGKFPRCGFGAAYLQLKPQKTLALDSAEIWPDWSWRRCSIPSNAVGCVSQVSSPPLMVKQNVPHLVTFWANFWRCSVWVLDPHLVRCFIHFYIDLTCMCVYIMERRIRPSLRRS